MLLYLSIIIPVSFGFCALGVDAGHCMLVKAQLQNAADAAARAGALNMPTSRSAAISAATSTAASNYANGTTITLNSSTDIEFLNWTSKTNNTVVSVANYSTANAIKVTTRRTAAANTAVKLFFGGMIGLGSMDVTASSVATFSGGNTTAINVSGQCDPWLAGMPSGTTANFVNETSPVDGHAPWYDAAPTNSPAPVTGLTLTAGANLHFNFSGNISNWSGANTYGPDGDPSWADHNWYAMLNGGSEHGISDLVAPLASLIGVFLDNNAPNADGSTVPPTLDFSTSASRDFSTLSPQIRQPFFIGDGLRNDGVTPQNFVVPSGATRLYIGIMDFQEWSDNSGTDVATVTHPIVVKTVQ
jgi:Flp pilus assembly protein TadG